MSRHTGETEGAQSDEDLVRSALGGCREGFALLYLRHYSRTYRLAYGMTANPGASEDLTQEIFMRAFQKLGQFKFQSSFATWLYRLALNHCLNYRGRARGADAPLPEEDSLQSSERRGEAEEGVLRDEVQTQVHRALLTLKPKLRLIVILKDLEGLSYEQIAEHLNIPPGTVASRLNSARKLLALKLEHLKGVV